MPQTRLALLMQATLRGETDPVTLEALLAAELPSMGEQEQYDDERSGEDDDSRSSFFQPYRYAIPPGSRCSPRLATTTPTLRAATTGHRWKTTSTSERFRKQQGRASVGRGLFYRFCYGGNLGLICLDTSQDSDDSECHRFFQVPDHQQWLEDALAMDDPIWRIPFSHHPVFCAGPSHENDHEMIETPLPLFERGGARLVLAGHEHNFQVSEVDGRTYVVSGAGGKLRGQVPEWFDEAHTTAWATQAHRCSSRSTGTKRD